MVSVCIDVEIIMEITNILHISFQSQGISLDLFKELHLCNCFHLIQLLLLLLLLLSVVSLLLLLLFLLLLLLL